jgi:two-component system, sensor histidine kinase RegB
MTFAASTPRPAGGPSSPAAELDDDGDTRRILLRWLVGLRWAVFLILAATLPLGERFLGFHVRYEVALPVIALVVIFNAVMHRRIGAARTAPDGGAPGPVRPRDVALGVAIDLVAIGALLAASGGAANPFSAVFFVHVALAASLLPARTTFALAALAVCLFASLFALPAGACCPSHPANGAFSDHLYGMWAAFAVASGLVAHFLTQVRRALDARGREIARLRRRADEVARFAGLGTLAAGTAHELATPLGTIAVLAGEIEDAPAEAPLHAAAIKRQVARCRDVITSMQAAVQPAEERSGTELLGSVERAVATWRAAHPAVEVAVRGGGDALVPLSESEIATALCALLDNAHHATLAGSAPSAIAVEVEAGGPSARVGVEDTGVGVPREILDRLGEPFLTTKQPGEGMGLGLYLVRRLLEQVGGRLTVRSRDRGTVVSLHLRPVHLHPLPDATP